MPLDPVGAPVIACVYKSGGIYTPEYVARLFRAVRRYVPFPHLFACWTDRPADVANICDATITLQTDWPGWWAKMELFRPEIGFERILYLDLDTLIIGDLSFACYVHIDTILRDFYRPHQYGSAMMLIANGRQKRDIWRAFTADPQGAMRSYRGDQDFLLSVAGTYWTRWQDGWPGQIVSYKPIPGGPYLARKPDGASIVCLHGEPRLYNLKPGNWAHDHWIG